MFIFDSDHTREHVLREMLLYADLVTPGSYMIVEDGNIHDHPVYVDFGPGPQEVIEEFLPKRNELHQRQEPRKVSHFYEPERLSSPELLIASGL